MPAGPSILERLWAELDRVVDRLKAGPVVDNDKGVAQGLTLAIAIMTNPYEPNTNAIRREAMIRWRERQENADRQVQEVDPQ